MPTTKATADNLLSQDTVERGILKRTYRDAKGKTFDVYRADGAYDSRRKKRLASKTFKGKGALQAARSHRARQQSLLERGELSATGKATVEQAAWCFMEGAAAGTVKNKHGALYKPSVLRQYEIKLRLQILPEFRNVQLTELTAADVNKWIGELPGKSSTVRNALIPLRAIYRVAILRGYAVRAANPTEGIEPRENDETPRDRIATPDEAERLLAALAHPRQRALWAVAMYAGLRRGEIMGLRWSDVDFDARLIRVRRNYDPESRTFGTPKTKNGTRDALVPAPLLAHLMAIRQPASDALVFPAARDAELPFVDQTNKITAQRAWRRAGLEPISLHECRHTCATWMIFAELNIKEVSMRLGHAGVQITLDRYGHLLPGGELEAMGLMEAFLAKRAAGERAA